MLHTIRSDIFSELPGYIARANKRTVCKAPCRPRLFAMKWKCAPPPMGSPRCAGGPNENAFAAPSLPPFPQGHSHDVRKVLGFLDPQHSHCPCFTQPISTVCTQNLEISQPSSPSVRTSYVNIPQSPAAMLHKQEFPLRIGIKSLPAAKRQGRLVSI